MDEHGTHLKEVSKTTAPRPATSLKKRFVGFLLCHWGYNTTFIALYWTLSFYSDEASSSPFPLASSVFSGIRALPPIVLLLSIIVPYFLLGVLTARLDKWIIPTRQEKFLATVRLSIVPVSYALLFALLYMGGSFYLTIGMILLAVPPYCFGRLFLSLFPFNGSVAFVLSALLAAVLPPLLFSLGSFFQAKRQKFSPQG